MRVLFLMAAALAAGSCGQSKFDQAKERVAFLERNGGDAAELCKAKRAVAEAAIDEGRDADYRLADAEAGLQCSEAALGI